MERALDPALLQTALGPFQHLRSAEELARDLASVNLGLFAGIESQQVELVQRIQGLLPVAWSLFGSASSRLARERYGAPQQRAALQVAAHIFDLALSGMELAASDRLRLVFASQICFLRSQFQPNTSAIYRREVRMDPQELDFQQHANTLSLQCATALLAFDKPFLKNALFRLLGQAIRLEEDWETGMVDTFFAAQHLVLIGCRHLRDYLLDGDRQQLQQALEAWSQAVNNPHAQGDRTSRWTAACLIDAFSDLDQVSVWDGLPPEVPPSVRKALTYGTSPVYALWPSQLDLMKEDDGGSVFSAKRVLISMPTSAGKTLFSQILMLTHIAQQETGVCFVAPTRALCSEVRKSLRRKLQYVTRQAVGGDLPDWVVIDHNHDAAVDVMTPERLMHLLKTDREAVLRRFGMFVFDEAHNAGGDKNRKSDSRSFLVESLITTLNRITADTEHKMVLLSGVMGNKIHFMEWMSATSRSSLGRHSEWRGPRRMNVVLTAQTDWDKAEYLPKKRRYFKVRAPRHTHFHMKVRGARPLNVTYLEPNGTMVKRSEEEITPGNRRRLQREGKLENDSQNTPFEDYALPVIQHLLSLGPLLIITASKAEAERMAKKVADLRSEQGGPSALLEAIDSILGQSSNLKSLVGKGVAYHHGALPGEIRVEIEDAMVEGSLQCLVATSTMTEGVNLPVKSVFIASTGMHTEEGYEEFIVGSRLKNALGRAGRAGRETEGIVVFALRDATRVEATLSMLNAISRGEDEGDTTDHSFLGIEDSLVALEQYEQARGEFFDRVFEAQGGHLEHFLSFLWYVFSEYDHLTDEERLTTLEGYLSASLAWTQLDDGVKRRWLSLGADAHVAYKKLPEHKRKTWAKSGFTMGTAMVLDAIAEQVCQDIIDKKMPEDTFKQLFHLLSTHQNSLFGVRELQTMQIRTSFNGPPLPGVDWLGILESWCKGSSVHDICKTHLTQIRNEDFRAAQMVEFIGNTVDVKLSALLQCIVKWAGDKFKIWEEGNPQFFSLDRHPISEKVPHLLKFGVDTQTAVDVMMDGVASRRLAIRVAAEHLQHGKNTPIKEWVAGIPLHEWPERFGAYTSEVRMLLDFVGTSTRGFLYRLVQGEELRVPWNSNWEYRVRTPVVLKEGASSTLPIQVFWEDQHLGDVPPAWQNDLLELIRADFPVVVFAETLEDRNELCISLRR